MFDVITNGGAPAPSTPANVAELGFDKTNNIPYFGGGLGWHEILNSSADALTAHAGGGQGSALPLPARINRVTTVGTAADSVLLPPSTPGKVVFVINAAAANSMNIFPQTGDIINALSANTALAVVVNKTVIFVCAKAGQWHTVLTA